MEITKIEKNSVIVLNLSGRIDLSSGAGLKEEIKTLIGQKQNQIHLNLADVDFINSSGLGVLVSIMKEIRQNKGRLTLSNLASYVNEIFEITQLSHIFEIFTSEEEAMTSYQSVSAGL